MDDCRRDAGLDLPSFRIHRERAVDLAVDKLQGGMSFEELSRFIHDCLGVYLDEARQMSPEDFALVIDSVLDSDAWQSLFATEVHLTILRLEIRRLTGPGPISGEESNAIGRLIAQGSDWNQLGADYAKIISDLLG